MKLKERVCIMCGVLDRVEAEEREEGIKRRIKKVL